MNKYEDKKMNAQAWEKGRTNRNRTNSPERNAYMIISYFFDANSLTDEKCEEFKSWFMGDEYELTEKQ